MASASSSELTEAVHVALLAAAQDNAEVLGEAVETVLQHGPKGVYLAVHAWTGVSARAAWNTPPGAFWEAGAVTSGGSTGLNGAASLAPAQKDAARLIGLLRNGDHQAMIAIVRNYWNGDDAALAQFLMAVLRLAAQAAKPFSEN